MSKPAFLAAALVLGGLAMPVLAASQADSFTTAFFEKHHVLPRGAAKLRATISDRIVSIRDLKSGAIERVYYGDRRVDAKGDKTKYRIIEGAIEEEHGDVPRMLLIYDWRGHAYVCLENVGDLDELDGAEGTCPYEIVATEERTRGK